MAMVEKLVGKLLRSKMESLQMAFTAACRPFHDEMQEAAAAYAVHQEKVDSGDAEWVQSYGDGDHFNYEDQLIEQRSDAEDALNELRRAFSFLIYHQWERASQRWTTTKRPVHTDLIDGAKAHGIPVDEKGLEELRLVVNTLKHNSATCGQPLHTARPDLFDPAFDPTGDDPTTGAPWKSINWAEQVVLKDKDIVDFLATVSISTAR